MQRNVSNVCHPTVPDLKSTGTQDSGALVLGHIRGGGAILLGHGLGRKSSGGGLVEFYLLLLVETLLCNKKHKA